MSSNNLSHMFKLSRVFSIASCVATTLSKGQTMRLANFTNIEHRNALAAAESRDIQLPQMIAEIMQNPNLLCCPICRDQLPKPWEFRAAVAKGEHGAQRFTPVPKIPWRDRSPSVIEGEGSNWGARQVESLDTDKLPNVTVRNINVDLDEKQLVYIAGKRTPSTLDRTADS
ncbi:hypothetical protein BDR22DRAFT_823700 [Usnea florida]